VWRLPCSRRDVDAVQVHPRGDDVRAGLCQCAAGAGIPGFFEPHAVARIEQQAADHLQRALRAGDDEHLIRGARGAARRLHVFRESLPQISKSRYVGVIELAERHRAQASCDEV